MINLEYDTWRNVCEGIFTQSKQSLNKYLQLYPFSILSKDEIEIIKSEEFFYRFIINGALFKNKLENDKHHYKVGDFFLGTHFRTLGDMAGISGYGPAQF